MPTHASQPERILLVRPSALGDVCRSVPVLASLNAKWPGAEIDWLVQDTFADAVRHHPALHAVVPFPRKALGRTSKRGNLLPSIRWMNTHLRAHQYDLVVDAQGLFRSGLFTWWTRAPRRIGDANARETAGMFYTERHRVPTDMHTVDRMLKLLELAGIEPIADMRLHTDPGESAWVERELPEPYVVLAPTSRWVAKQWPSSRFAELARTLLDDDPARRVVLVGGPGEAAQVPELVELAASESRVVNLIGTTSVGRLMAVIELAQLVVANDSAALHMAVGFGRPIVALFGPTRVDRVGPYRVGPSRVGSKQAEPNQRDADVLQQVTEHDTLDHKEPANRVLMDRITTAEVLAACRARL